MSATRATSTRSSLPVRYVLAHLRLFSAYSISREVKYTLCVTLFLFSICLQSATLYVYTSPAGVGDSAIGGGGNNISSPFVHDFPHGLFQTHTILRRVPGKHTHPGLYVLDLFFFFFFFQGTRGVGGATLSFQPHHFTVPYAYDLWQARYSTNRKSPGAEGCDCQAAGGNSIAENRTQGATGVWVSERGYSYHQNNRPCLPADRACPLDDTNDTEWIPPA